MCRRVSEARTSPPVGGGGGVGRLGESHVMPCHIPPMSVSRYCTHHHQSCWKLTVDSEKICQREGARGTTCKQCDAAMRYVHSMTCRRNSPDKISRLQGSGVAFAIALLFPLNWFITVITVIIIIIFYSLPEPLMTQRKPCTISCTPRTFALVRKGIDPILINSSFPSYMWRLKF